MSPKTRKLLRRLTGVLAAAGILVAIFIWLNRPKLIDTNVNGDYTAELLALDSPDWPFGSQDGRLVLKKAGWTVCEQDFTLHNDGKGMDRSNWSVAWDDEKAAVTIKGEEQHDALYHLYFTGAAVRVKTGKD